MPLRKRASSELEAKGCADCGKNSEKLFHFTNKGGVKQSEAINHPGAWREKALSKIQDFSAEAFCSFGCFEWHESKKLQKVPELCRPKRPF
ncbi:MAG: hypothetical protein ACRD2L_02970 [Terriglobia bacterium]